MSQTLAVPTATPAVAAPVVTTPRQSITTIVAPPAFAAVSLPAGQTAGYPAANPVIGTSWPLSSPRVVSTPLLPPAAQTPRGPQWTVPIGPATPRLPPTAVPVRPSGEPLPPPSLTAGIPSPQDIDAQKAAYSNSLSNQLDHGTSVLDAQLQQQREVLRQIGEEQKMQYGIQVDRAIKQQELQLSKQRDEQLLLLKQTTQQQRAALEQQANALLMEYSQKKTQEELLAQQYQYQLERYQAQLRHAGELQAMEQARARSQAQAMAHNQRLKMSRAEVAAQQAALRQQSFVATQQAALAAQVAAGSSSHLAAEATARAHPVPVACKTPRTSYVPPPTPYSVNVPSALPPTIVQPQPVLLTSSASYAAPVLRPVASHVPVPTMLSRSYTPPLVAA